MSGCRARGGAGDRPDAREHAAGVPGWERSYQRRRAIELDAALADGLGPSEPAGVPFDEGFCFRRDVEVLFETRVCLADIGVAEIDEKLIVITAGQAGPGKSGGDRSKV